MKMAPMKIPETREEFENRLHRLHYSVHHGKMHFMRDQKQIIEELVQLREMPNGRIDLLTVDELVRLQANMVVQFDGMLDGLEEE